MKFVGEKSEKLKKRIQHKRASLNNILSNMKNIVTSIPNSKNLSVEDIKKYIQKHIVPTLLATSMIGSIGGCVSEYYKNNENNISDISISDSNTNVDTHTEHDNITIIPQGTLVKFTESTNQTDLVYLNDSDYNGYIMKNDINEYTPYTVTSPNGLNMRSSAGLDTEKIGIASTGDTLYINLDSATNKDGYLWYEAIDIDTNQKVTIAFGKSDMADEQYLTRSDDSENSAQIGILKESTILIPSDYPSENINISENTTKNNVQNQISTDNEIHNAEGQNIDEYVEPSVETLPESNTNEIEPVADTTITNQNEVTYEDELSDFDDYPGYKQFLEQLKLEHPNWIFKIQKTGLDFNTAVESEHSADNYGTSLLQNTAWSAKWLDPVQTSVKDGSTWVCASKEAIACLMDPRNFLNETQIFQFETKQYNEKETLEAISTITNSVPWMQGDTISYTTTSGEIATLDKSFAEVIMEAAKESNLSASYLASKIIIEQGKGDTPGNTGCGNIDGYLGYYNYANINSYGTGANIWISGLNSAMENGWTDPEKAIHGAAKFLAEKYIENNQDTIYSTKFNLNDAYEPTHQYMTNILGAYQETEVTKETYDNANLTDEMHVFIIPVYENMPQELSPLPDTSLYIDNDQINATKETAEIETNDSQSVLPIKQNLNIEDDEFDR